jgi:hypothetical protein
VYQSFLLSLGARPISARSPLVKHLEREQWNTSEKESKEVDLLKISPLFGGFALPRSRFFDTVNPKQPYVLPPHVQRFKNDESPLVSSAIIQTRVYSELEASCLATRTQHLVSDRLPLSRFLDYTLQIYSRDVRIVRAKRPQPEQKRGSRSRGKINAFSWRSRRRLGFTANNPRYAVGSQVALTYHQDFPSDGAACKSHLNTFLTWFRKNYPSVKYLWIFEFQSRGAPHFHLFLTIPPSDSVRKNIAVAWNRIIRGSQQNLRFQKHQRNMIPWRMDGAYVTKYLSKTYQKAVPDAFINCGRFWGCSQNFVSEPLLLHSTDLDSPSSLLRLLENLHIAVCRSAAKKMGRTYKKPRWRRNHSGSFAIPKSSAVVIRLIS